MDKKYSASGRRSANRRRDETFYSQAEFDVADFTLESEREKPVRGTENDEHMAAVLESPPLPESARKIKPGWLKEEFAGQERLAGRAKPLAEPVEIPQETRKQQLFRRFLRDGIDGFLHQEILELLLYIGGADNHAVENSYDLLGRFGIFSQVFLAGYDEIAAMPDMTPEAALLLKLLPSFARRYAEELISYEDVLDTSEKVGRFLIPRFIGRETETVMMLCMDNACRLLRWDILEKGSLTGAAVEMRNCLQTAYECKAANVILAHNHPVGLPRPSAQDIRTTRLISAMFRYSGIALVDHFIIAGDSYLSMMEEGLFGAELDSVMELSPESE